MNEYTSIYLRDIYECERKALEKAAVNESGERFMLGIINMVKEIEDNMLDGEEKREAAKNDT